MALIAGPLKPAGEASNFPGTFQLKSLTSTITLTITGDTDPDCTRTYPYAGESGGFPYYRRSDAAYELWFHPVSRNYIISTARGVTTPGFWRLYEALIGTYTPWGDYTGDPTTAWQTGGIIRLRIHGRRFGSGARPDYYEETPVTPAGFYPFSPLQAWCRMNAAQMLAAYAKLPPFAPIYVTGVLTPDIIGSYGGIDLHNDRAHWWNEEHAYHVYWFSPQSRWFIAREFPDNPQNGDPYWFRTDPSPYGAYAPWQGASGIATLFAPED